MISNTVPYVVLIICVSFVKQRLVLKDTDNELSVVVYVVAVGYGRDVSVQPL